MSEWVLDLQAELQELVAIEAESIGWPPLGAPEPGAAAGGGEGRGAQACR